MGDLRQPHHEALLLLPIDVPPSLNVTFEMVASTLMRQTSLSANVPYKWGFIDKPKDGDTFLLFHRGGPLNLVDGLVYLEAEHRFMVPRQGNAPDAECFEKRQGFIPGMDNQAFRIRRMFHFVRPPANPQLFVIHYSRSAAPVPVAQHLHQPIRSYPLPHLPPLNIFIAGPRAGEMVHDEEARQIVASAQSRGHESMSGHQRYPQHGGAYPKHSNAPGYGAVAQEISNQAALLRELERKRRQNGPLPRKEDEDSADEDSSVSVRALALSRYKRNHEMMEEVFYRAAFGAKKAEQPSDATIRPLKLEDINQQLAAAEAEVAELERKAAERQRLRDEREQAAEAMIA